MAQQTAIEWLKEQLENNSGLGHISIEWLLLDNLIVQAKAMEKEQMINTYTSACARVTPYGYYGYSAEQYYNETYGK